jgi:hypothetical protein
LHYGLWNRKPFQNKYLGSKSPAEDRRDKNAESSFNPPRLLTGSSTRILKYVDDLKRGSNAGIGPKDYVEIAFKKEIRMFVKIFKTAVLIFGILCVVFSLSACDRMKAAIGFKWGQIQMSDPYREAKNSRKEIGPAVAMDQNTSIGTAAGTGFSGQFENPV